METKEVKEMCQGHPRQSYHLPLSHPPLLQASKSPPKTSQLRGSGHKALRTLRRRMEVVVMKVKMEAMMEVQVVKVVRVLPSYRGVLQQIRTQRDPTRLLFTPSRPSRVN